MIILAEAVTGADPMISGNWIIAVLGAAGTLAGILLGHAKGKASQEITIKDQPVQFQKSQRPVSFDQHASLEQRVGRIEVHLDVIQRDQANQYRQIIEAGSERELRLTETLNRGLREVHERLDGLMKPTPPRTR